MLVVLRILVRLEVVREALGILSDLTTLRCLEIVDHAVVEGKYGGRRTDFSTHVADCSHTRARERLDSRTLVLDNSTSSTLDGEDTRNLENNVCNTVTVGLQ